MIRMMLASGAVLALVWSAQVGAVSCDRSKAANPLPVRTTPVPPLYSGMLGRPAALATPRLLLAESRDEALALDVVLMRLNLEACASEPVNEYADYVPQTEFDNTPYRFNMEKGRKFTAAEFDAWMKSRGVRIVRAPATGAAPAETGATDGAATATVSE